MELTDKLRRDTGNPNRTVDDVLADLSNLRNWLISPIGTKGLVNPPLANSPLTLMLAMAQAYPALVAKMDGLSTKDFTDEPAIVQGVLASLTPEKIAEAIPRPWRSRSRTNSPAGWPPEARRAARPSGRPARRSATTVSQ